MHRDAFLARLDELLTPHLFTDYCPNGLQVEGREDVRRVVTGVTASQALIDAAVARGADAIVVHHGILWNGASLVVKGSHRKRLETLLGRGITLAGYHLPLDRHPDVGNNAPALRDLGLVDLAPFAAHKGTPIGWKGRFETPIAPADLVARIASYYGREPLAFLDGPERISTLGLVSGAAQGDLTKAVDERLDAFLTGEVSEPQWHLAKEERVHFLSVGHHASERVGPRRLAEWITTHLGLEAEFVDVPNPV